MGFATPAFLHGVLQEEDIVGVVFDLENWAAAETLV
jgi:hypothetical protein